MPIVYDDTNVSNILYNGVPINEVYYDGVKVFGEQSYYPVTISAKVLDQYTKILRFGIEGQSMSHRLTDAHPTITINVPNGSNLIMTISDPYQGFKESNWCRYGTWTHTSASGLSVNVRFKPNQDSSLYIEECKNYEYKGFPYYLTATVYFNGLEGTN